MKREQIIEILKNPHWFLNGKLFESDFERIADAILALPLDVPSDEEVMEESLNGHINLFDRGWMSYFNDSERGIFIQGATWMKEEIIKRNK